MKNMTTFCDCNTIVQRVIDHVGKDIVLGTPLGAGKPNHLLNAFYRRAVEDTTIRLTVCTALTLQRPVGKSDLEQRFIDLFDRRLFGDYPDLLYELDRVSGRLPDNIRIIEFYFAPGKYLTNSEVQRDYISSNYTHVSRDVLDRGVNVIAQMVSKQEINGQLCYSLSSNPDVTLDMARLLKQQNPKALMLAQVNQNLPFMFGDAMVPATFFNLVSDDPADYYMPFGPPKTSVPDVDYMIGLYCSALVVDDGEIQVGIGSLGDASIHSLILRQKQNKEYRAILTDLEMTKRFPEELAQCGSDLSSFDKGLLGASEMIVDGFRHLYEHGIIKKKVYDHIGLQHLLNKGLIVEEFDHDILQVLWSHKVIHERLSEADFKFLVKWGIFKEGLTFRDGHIYLNEHQFASSYINDPANLAFFKEYCYGRKLKNGHLMHGGFFLGPQSFYRWLAGLPEEERKLINMKSVQKINQLYGHERLDRLHRKNARFINSCMMHTLSGAAVSDGLEDGTVVSGVGGQYNFVAMAQELPDGRSILNLRSTRIHKGKLQSNIVPFYGHHTIPRHLRDVVVTEYGIAVLRGKTDEEIIKALLNICDSRFQNELLRWAKQCGKLTTDYQIPAQFTNNRPESYLPILQKYKQRDLFPAFPFGTELTKEELVIGKGLKALSSDLPHKIKILKNLVKGLFSRATEDEDKLLEMMRLNSPSGISEKLYRALLLSKLQEQRSV